MLTIPKDAPLPKEGETFFEFAVLCRAEDVPVIREAVRQALKR